MAKACFTFQVLLEAHEDSLSSLQKSGSMNLCFRPGAHLPSLCGTPYVGTTSPRLHSVATSELSLIYTQIRLPLTLGNGSANPGNSSLCCFHEPYGWSVTQGLGALFTCLKICLSSPALITGTLGYNTWVLSYLNLAPTPQFWNTCCLPRHTGTPGFWR